MIISNFVQYLDFGITEAALARRITTCPPRFSDLAPSMDYIPRPFYKSRLHGLASLVLAQLGFPFLLKVTREGCHDSNNQTTV